MATSATGRRDWLYGVAEGFNGECAYDGLEGGATPEEIEVTLNDDMVMSVIKAELRADRTTSGT